MKPLPKMTKPELEAELAAVLAVLDRQRRKEMAAFAAREAEDTID